jgi:glycerol kinase
MLMDLATLEWHQPTLELFGIEEKWLPTIVKSNAADFGSIAESRFARLAGVQIGGVIGDQQAACLGHCLRPGEVKTTYGTGCFILTNVGNKPVQSTAGLLSTVCFKINDQTQYALEGAVEVAGAAIQWAKSVGLITDNAKIEPEALSVADCGDVYFVPAF